jgi:4-hydroxy-tetrahydrodipicolinate reductase
MKIFLFGYGQMGKEIELMANNIGHEIIHISDPPQNLPFDMEKLKEADVAIDYSGPSAVVENIYHCFDANTPVVVGTTGWYDMLPAVSEKCVQHSATFFYSPNYSIGVNILFKINEILARFMSSFGQYAAEVHEAHHLKKVDKPSGTAIRLANDILTNSDIYKNWLCLPENENMPAENKDLPVYYLREPDVVGIHEVKYFSDIDELSIRHKANSRKGFVLGTLIATEWIVDKRGIYTMSDLLNF